MEGPVKIFWLLVVLLSCLNCNKTYTAQGTYTEDWHLNADREVVKGSKTTVTYKWD